MTMSIKGNKGSPNLVLPSAGASAAPRKEPNMTKKKLPSGIAPRGIRWRVDTFYKGVRIRETCATPEMAETNLRKIQTLIDEGRYLEKKREPKDTLGAKTRRRKPMQKRSPALILLWTNWE
jgi:hypothetical protein